jgi:translocation and assembly module TamB
MLEAHAKLTGTAARPTGSVHFAATGLRLRSGAAAALPAAAIAADATLAGTTARVQARMTSGRNDIDLSGTAPIDPAAAMDLHARGNLDLAALDPLMAAQGRRVRGQVALDATVTGALAAPRADGTLRLTGGEVQDFAQGAHLSDIQALIRASGDTVRIASFTGHAGGGTVAASGSVGLDGAMPVDLHVTAKNASPLSSDKLTAVLDMDLALRGDLEGRLAASGTIKVDKADIRIPEQLPAKVVVLDVRRPGQTPPPPPSPGPDIGLDVTVNAPGQVFVRGRGLFAELQGRIHVTGTTAAPQPAGKFELRRGEFNLAGRTLTFTSGEVGFDGSGSIDPTLNFIASSTNGNITATLAITGYASAPKIALSSVPDLPQDEVLAQLLFHQSASSLSAFQLAEAAAALAQISGVAGGVFDPLNAVRQGLGLDRLSVGGSQNGSGASVEAGRYVARGVYVGAKQATSGGGTQATVQIDLMKGLKLETDVGTGGATSATGASATDDPNGTSVGLTYHFDY